MGRRRSNPPSRKPINQIQPKTEASLQKAGEASVLIHEEHFRSGPLPDPKELALYNDIVPNGAERIFIQFEQQSEHRRLLENKVINNDIRNSRLGMFFSFLISLAAIVGSTWVSLTRSVWEGLLTIIAVLLIGLCSLLLADKSRTEERRIHRSNSPEDNKNEKS